MNSVPKKTQKGNTSIWGKGHTQTHKVQMVIVITYKLKKEQKSAKGIKTSINRE